MPIFLIWPFGLREPEKPQQNPKKRIQSLQLKQMRLQRNLIQLENERAALDQQLSQLARLLPTLVQQSNNLKRRTGLCEQEMKRAYITLKELAEGKPFLQDLVGKANPQDMTKLSKKPGRMKEKLRVMFDMSIESLRSQHPIFVEKYEQLQNKAQKYLIYDTEALKAEDILSKKLKEKNSVDRKLNKRIKQLSNIREEIRNLQFELYDLIKAENPKLKGRKLHNKVLLGRT